jgi:hypothetical protein
MKNQIYYFKPHKSLILIAMAFCLFIVGSEVQAQGKRHIIQFSGFVLGGDDGQPLVGANLFIPKAGRGTNTNAYGFFTMPTMAGDSVIISAVGFKKRFFVMPDMPDEGYSVVIELNADTTLLPVVEVHPYPTEELFKQAFLALELPDEKDREAIRKNLNQQLMARMAYEAGMTPNENFRTFNQQQLTGQTNRYFTPTIPFLNPFAWAKFIKSVKKGDLKKKDWQQ